MIDKSVLIMVVMRLFSGSLEIMAALFMFRFNNLEKAFYINTMLALVGPTVLIITTAVAMFGLADKISMTRMICLFAGVTLILISMNAK
ncbi:MULTISPECIES: YqhV family protein [Rummeliibacillus]|uniref:YqhV family protein n=1 Tax=Rummeliibacillus TaxID=648802 RepID=UPI003530DD92